MKKFIALFVYLYVLPSSVAAEELRIVNIRVGQGDATLIQGPVKADGTRVNVLFDAGDVPSRDGGNILRAVLHKNDVEKLDFVIISHDDADHLGGVAFGGFHGKSFLLGFDDAVGCPGDDDGDGIVDWLPGHEFIKPDPEELGNCEEITVDNWVDYGEENMRDNTVAIKKYNGFANAMGERITIASQDAVNDFSIDLGGGATMTAYAGFGFVRGRATRVSNVSSPNEKSLSFLVTYDDFDFLISGDLIGKGRSAAINAKMEQAVAEAVVRDGRQVDVLHVNHHGADNGSAADFLKMIKPNIAIISAGNGNDHSHPKNSVLKRLSEAGVYRTILTSFGNSSRRIANDVRENVAIFQADIVITTNGDSYEVSTSRAYHADKRCSTDPSGCSRGLR